MPSMEQTENFDVNTIYQTCSRVYGLCPSLTSPAPPESVSLCGISGESVPSTRRGPFLSNGKCLL